METFYPVIAGILWGVVIFYGLAERTLGRKLVQGEVVHHIDGVKDNNSPQNLWVYDRREHRRMHNEDAFKVLQYFFFRGKVGFKNGEYFIK